MTVQRFIRSPWTLFGSVALAFGLTLAACGGDEAEGTTPKCPELPLYDIRNEDAASAAQHQAERLDIQDTTGCVTGPGDAGTNVTTTTDSATD